MHWVRVFGACAFTIPGVGGDRRRSLFVSQSIDLLSYAITDHYDLGLSEEEKRNCATNSTRVVSLNNLPQLHTFFLADGCFIDVRSLKITGVPQLTSLVTGDSCFAGTEWVEIAMPSVRTLSVGNGSFRFTQEVSFSGLSSLESFTTGRFAFHCLPLLDLSHLSKLTQCSIGYRSFESAESAFFVGMGSSSLQSKICQTCVSSLWTNARSRMCRRWL